MTPTAQAMQLFDFFDRLAANNNRPWFNDHKDEYLAIRAAWIAGIQRTIAALAEDWPEVRYLDAARSTYRIYRDIRFSNDKTPFKTHISSTITPPALLRSHAGMYIEAGADRSSTGVYAGIWCPDTPTLRKLRRDIVDNGEEWLEAVTAPDLVALYGSDWYGSRLKTAPKGYSPDHEMIEYLRLKDFGKYATLDRSFFAGDDWPERLAGVIRPAIPLVRFIIYSMTEEQ